MKIWITIPLLAIFWSGCNDATKTNSARNRTVSEVDQEQDSQNLENESNSQSASGNTQKSASDSGQNTDGSGAATPSPTSPASSGGAASSNGAASGPTQGIGPAAGKNGDDIEAVNKPDPKTEKKEAQKLESNPENYCKGLAEVLKTTDQDLKEEAALLCNGTTPTALFKELLEDPYNGQDRAPYRELVNEEDGDNETSFYTVGYSIQMPVTPNVVLSVEENQSILPYQEGDISITAKFLDPPTSMKGAEAGFTVEQFMAVTDRVSFEDTSVHNLRMYRPFVQNQDIFISARTLDAKSEQFYKLTILRAVISDPNDAEGTVSVSVIGVEMNSRDEHDRLLEAFEEFFRETMTQTRDLSLNR